MFTEVIAKLKLGYHFFGPLCIAYGCSVTVISCRIAHGSGPSTGRVRLEPERCQHQMAFLMVVATFSLSFKLVLLQRSVTLLTGLLTSYLLA